MQKFLVTGMSCAACSSRVERAVQVLPSVRSCSVSLLTNTLGVEGDVSAKDVVEAVTSAGYGCSQMGTVEKKDSQRKDTSAALLTDQESPILARRLIISLLLLVPLMYVATGHMLWNWPLPHFFEGNFVAKGLLQLLLALLVMTINKKFFISGWQSLRKGAPNMDTLVALGSGASFGWSTLLLFAMTRAQTDGDIAHVQLYGGDLYFESAAMIVTLITVGKLLEAKSKGKTTDALKDLIRLQPQTAVVVRDAGEVTVPINEVQKGDIFVVRPGEHIPVDGRVLEGVSALNEAAITGENIPVDKGPNDLVTSATQNLTGFLKCRAERVGEDTTIAQIIQLVSDAQATKAPIARVADKVSGIFVPAVLGVAVVTALVWLLVGQEVGFALARGIAVLVISCPCALGLATPVAIMVGSGLGAKNGILFKTAASLEEIGKVQTVCLDKTGTVTCATPKVTDIFACEGIAKEDLLTVAFSLERKSAHPLAQACVRFCAEEGITCQEIEKFQNVTGSGLHGWMGEEEVWAGNAKFIGQNNTIPEILQKKAESLAEEGKTPLFFARGGTVLGLLGCADTVKEESAAAVSELKAMGIKVVLLTGDTEKTAQAIAKELNISDVISGVKPDEKEACIRRLQRQGRVAMVGDGINDAPALSRADLGIAIGAGSDIALDSADIVLVKNRLTDVPGAIRLGRATLKNVHENLFWAFCYNVIGIPIAAGLLYPLLGLKLSPMLGAACMSLSSFCVVTNALRLNLFNPYGTKKTQTHEDTNEPIKEAEVTKKTCTIRVQGMMCEHCEAHVQKALGKLPFVGEAMADHKAGLVQITLLSEPNEAEISQAITTAGYTYDGFTTKEQTMQKVLRVNGMKCPHCEAHMKEALEKVDGITEAVANHSACTVEVTMTKEIAEDTFAQVVKEAGYEYGGLVK